MPVLDCCTVLALSRNPKRASVRNMSESDRESALNNNGVSMCAVQMCVCVAVRFSRLSEKGKHDLFLSCVI